MLSKSAARAFFLGGTAVCSLAFVALTVDTFGKIPEQTNAAAITPEVERGKALWEASNCMGCHTLFGEGAYYGPELTRVYERRGPDFIRAMLRDPEAMYHTLTGKLAKLPPSTVLFPGHHYGPTPTSTIADELRDNVYLRVRSLDDWRRLMGG